MARVTGQPTSIHCPRMNRSQTPPSPSPNPWRGRSPHALERYQTDPRTLPSPWRLKETRVEACSSEAIRIKQEEEESGVPFFSERPRTPRESMSPMSPISPVSPSLSPVHHSSVDDRRGSDWHWRDAELLGPDSVQPHDFDDSSWQSRVESFDSSTVTALPNLRSPPLNARACLPPSLDLTAAAETQPFPEVFTPSLITSLTSLSLRTPTSPEVPKSDALKHASSSRDVKEGQEDGSQEDDATVVHPCDPCTPTVIAMQLEGV